MMRLHTQALIIMAGAAGLFACHSDYQDVVVRECVLDGQPIAYCECTADTMKWVLGDTRYAVFTDLIVLGGAESASPDDILKIMEKYALTPTEFAEMRGAIGEIGAQAHEQCAG